MKESTKHWNKHEHVIFEACIKENGSDPLARWFVQAWKNYYKKDSTPYIQLNTISPVQETDIQSYSDLEDSLEKLGQNNLQSLAVIKLNGGLGTSMGCKGPKSLINIDKKNRFIDMMLKQKAQYPDMPFLFMNSKHTHKAMEPFCCDAFIQHEVPRITQETGALFTHSDSNQQWAPPGHGNIYTSLLESGKLQQLIEAGINTLFISNSDNLCATVDPKILGYMNAQNIDCLMEVTSKTSLDKKGGALVKKNQYYHLLERAQVNPEEIHDFEDIQTFKLFNTNNLWINTQALLEKLESKQLELPIIINKKTVNNTDIIQFETAMGAAISVFENSALLAVNRDRFFPVKTASDLLILQSDLITKHPNGSLTWTADLPQIQLDPLYADITQFQSLTQHVPNVTQLKSLTITGPIQFGQNVILIGDVSIENNTDNPVTLSDITLNNKPWKN